MFLGAVTAGYLQQESATTHKNGLIYKPAASEPVEYVIEYVYDDGDTVVTDPFNYAAKKEEKEGWKCVELKIIKIPIKFDEKLSSPLVILNFLCSLT